MLSCPSIPRFKQKCRDATAALPTQHYILQSDYFFCHWRVLSSLVSCGWKFCLKPFFFVRLLLQGHDSGDTGAPESAFSWSMGGRGSWEWRPEALRLELPTEWFRALFSYHRSNKFRWEWLRKSLQGILWLANPFPSNYHFSSAVLRNGHPRSAHHTRKPTSGTAMTQWLTSSPLLNLSFPICKE